MADHNDPNTSDETPPEPDPSRSLQKQPRVRLDQRRELPTRPLRPGDPQGLRPESLRQSPNPPSWLGVPDPLTLSPVSEVDEAGTGLSGRPDARNSLVRAGHGTWTRFSGAEVRRTRVPRMDQEWDPDLFIAHRPEAMVTRRGQGIVGEVSGRKLSRQAMVLLEVMLAFPGVTYGEIELATGFPRGSIRNKMSDLVDMGLASAEEHAFEALSVYKPTRRAWRLANVSLGARPWRPAYSMIAAADAILTHLEYPTGAVVLTAADIAAGARPFSGATVADSSWVTPNGRHMQPDVTVFDTSTDQPTAMAHYLYVEAATAEVRVYCEHLLKAPDPVRITIISPERHRLDLDTWWPNAPGFGMVRTIHHVHPRPASPPPPLGGP